MPAVTASLNDLVARHALARADKVVHASLERLATGKRINRASDDPAGLIAADALAARRKALEKQIKEAEFASFALGAQEGGLSVIQDLLIELNGLVVAAANTGASAHEERDAYQLQADSILQAIEFVRNTTTFNGRRVLADGAAYSYGGSYNVTGALNTQGLGAVVNPNAPDPEAPGAPERGALGEEGDGGAAPTHYTLADLSAGGALNLVSGDLELAQQVAKGALESVARLRGAIGTEQKYILGVATAANRIELENTAEAESIIRDTDFAREVSAFLRGRVLRDAGLKVIDIARKQHADSVLTLLG